MAIYSFGSGTLWGTRTDVANSTPRKFGVLQDVGIEFSGTSKQLYGQYQFPVAVGRGKSKLTGKAKMAQISGSAYADLFFGITPSTGQVTTSNGEAQSVPAASSYTVTVANAATFATDLGVVYTSSGLPLTKVTAVTAVGQYSVNSATGVYTFFSGDASAAVLISYTYSVAASGQKLVYANQLLGVQPVFQIQLQTLYIGPAGQRSALLTLNACVASKLSFPTKQDDFSVQEFDFDAFADQAGNVFTWNFNEVS